MSDYIVVVDQSATKTVVVDQPTTKTVVVNQGLPGPPGPPGSSSGTITVTAGHDVSGHRIVCVSPDGKVRYADKDSHETAIAALGITLGAALAGAGVTIRPAGEVEELSWSFLPSLPVYLGNSGLLVQVAPSSGMVLQIGVPVSATKLFVSIKTPISQI